MKLKQASIFTKIVILALIVYATIMLVNTRQQAMQADADRANLQAQVDAMLRENAELQYEIEHADDPEIIAEIARSKLGLVTPGEKIFYDISN